MLYNEIKNIEFQITRKCNMRCFYCSNADGDMNKEQLDVFKYIEVVKQLPNLKKITLTGGEPTLTIKLLDSIVKDAKDRNILLQLNTNGFVRDIKMWNKLLSIFDIVHISSTNTMNKNIFSVIRGVKVDVFDIINRNIEYAYSCNGVKTIVEILIGTFNIKEIYLLYEFYRYRANEIQLQPLVVNGRASAVMQAEAQEISMIIKEILERQKVVTDTNVDLKLWCKFFCNKSITNETNNIDCECGLSTIYISNEGFVLPCNVAFYSNTYKSNSISLKEYSIIEILTNNKFYNMLYNDYELEIIKKQGLCKIFNKNDVFA